MRQRAFTLFVRTYDELRRAMTFLRWHEGDVDAIIPSLYAGRGGRRRTESETETEAPPIVGPAPVSDVVTDVAPNPENKPVATENKPRVGMPGSDPFVS